MKLRFGSGFRLGVLALTLAAAAQAASPPPAAIAVRQTEGVVHGFLFLRTLDGAIVAEGDSTQVTHGREVTNKMSLHFKDGSLQEETVVFTQSGHFHVVSYHQVQKGPAFKRPMDLVVNGATGIATATYKDENGKDKKETANLQLPADLANGIVPIVLKNVAAGAQSATASMVVAAPKPMLVKLAISAVGEDTFSVGATSHKAIKYAIKVEIGGVKGVLAPLVGKQPPDTLVWMLGGECPTFLKSEGPSFEGGPIWRTELTSAVWK